MHASDIETAVLAALQAGGFSPDKIVFAPAADDSALLSFNLTSADKRTVSVGVTIPAPPIPPQKVAPPGWGMSTIPSNRDTATINKNSDTGVLYVLKRYKWSDLEAAEGVYTLGAEGTAGTVMDDIAATRAWNLANPTKPRQMIFMIEDKSYNHPAKSLLPAYLQNEQWILAGYSTSMAIGYEWPNKAGGTSSLRFIPRVVERFNALTKYLASQLDALPEFCGISTLETADGLDSLTRKRFGYTPQRYADAYVSILTAASAAFVQSKVFWNFNFVEGDMTMLDYIAAKIAALPLKNVYAGGPDLLPSATSLTGPGMAYSKYLAFKALGIRTFIQFSVPGYSEVHSDGRRWTFQELHAFAVSKLGVSIILAMPVNSGYLKYNSGNAGDLLKVLPGLTLS